MEKRSEDNVILSTPKTSRYGDWLLKQCYNTKTSGIVEVKHRVVIVALHTLEETEWESMESIVLTTRSCSEKYTMGQEEDYLCVKLCSMSRLSREGVRG